MLKAGDKAPPFALVSHEGQTIRLADLRGRPVVLYFYPRDDTAGCTAQACDLRDNWSALQRQAILLGVSPDSVESHHRFREKYGLPFTLLADVNHEVAEAYGVWGEKSMYGKKYFGVMRTTFVIDQGGRIARVLEQVKPERHAAQVLDALKHITQGKNA